MSITPQLRLSFGLIALLVSTVFIADFLGLLPRPEEQIRDSRKLLGESLAVQLSSAAAKERSEFIVDTLREIVRRNDQVLHVGLWREDGRQIASFGEAREVSSSLFDMSSYEKLIIPITHSSTPLALTTVWRANLNLADEKQ